MTKATILIVEDEPAIADTIQYALESDGFLTYRMETGAAVEDLLVSMEIALIVLDIGLPDINGVELCKRLRKKHAVPIIFLTARDGEIDRVVGLELGADDYVTKPFSPRELSARVKAVLRRSNGTLNGPEVEFMFQVDESRHQIRYYDNIMELSRYEYRLLKTFISRPGQVFSREQLMDLVWECPESSLDRTVDAHIKNLRAKLREINPDHDPIITHRGIGYSLSESE